MKLTLTVMWYHKTDAPRSLSLTKDGGIRRWDYCQVTIFDAYSRYLCSSLDPERKESDPSALSVTA